MRATKAGEPIGLSAIARLFGSLTAVKIAAGLPTTWPNGVDAAQTRGDRDAQLLDQLRRLGAQVGRTPTSTEVDAARKRGEIVGHATSPNILAVGIKP